MLETIVDDGLSNQAQVDGASFPNANPIAFCDFNNKYAGGTCYVIGRGPTTFDYKELARISHPLFFINDAVCLEKYARSKTFFFAHDVELRPWLDGSIKSTAVLPVNGTILGHAPGVVLGHAGSVVFYHRQDEDREELMAMNRDQLADAAALFGHSGTIHSLLHFVWFCGFRRVIYIGCDATTRPHLPTKPPGSGIGYDLRLQNRSRSSPSPHYATIRMAQDFLTVFLGLETVYLGTPI